MTDKKIRYVLVCPDCGRIYKNFIPVPAQDSISVVMCKRCDTVIGRFDWGDKEYSEERA